jgi:imidazolonepropionase-like amidohydrolase
LTEGNVLIKAGRLIDGSGAAAVENASVLVKGSTIAAVYHGPVPSDAVPPGTRTLEFPSGTLLPGLIDCHVHLNLPGDGTDYLDSVSQPDGVLVATSTHNARVALEAGITTLRDTGGRGATTFEVRRALDRGYCTGSHLHLCGQPITITGGHTWHFGGEADGIDSVRRKAREMARLGADFIKVMGSGGGTPGTTSWLPSFSQEELSAVTDEAHRLGRKVTVHCLCAESIEYAVNAGVDQIEHAGFIVDATGKQRFEPAVADKVARAEIPVTGTLSVGEYILDTIRAKEKLDPGDQQALDRWDRMRAENFEQISGLLAAGVRLVAGTDAGWRFTPFDSLAEELRLMQHCGLSAMDAIVSATGWSARVLGIEGRTGTIREGLAADLLVVDGDPLADLAALKRPRLVVQSGQIRVEAPVEAIAATA